MQNNSGIDGLIILIPSLLKYLLCSPGPVISQDIHCTDSKIYMGTTHELISLLSLKSNFSFLPAGFWHLFNGL